MGDDNYAVNSEDEMDRDFFIHGMYSIRQNNKEAQSPSPFVSLQVILVQLLSLQQADFIGWVILCHPIYHPSFVMRCHPYAIPP